MYFRPSLDNLVTYSIPDNYTMTFIRLSIFLATALAITGVQASSECWTSVHNETIPLFHGAPTTFSYTLNTATDCLNWCGKVEKCQKLGSLSSIQNSVIFAARRHWPLTKTPASPLGVVIQPPSTGLSWSLIPLPYHLVLLTTALV